jgi:hypothetical protein
MIVAKGERLRDQKKKEKKKKKKVEVIPDKRSLQSLHKSSIGQPISRFGKPQTQRNPGASDVWSLQVIPK